MSAPVIYFFVKSFTDASHSEAFLDGLLYMNPLGYFIKLEESYDVGRGDRNEGTVAWLQPNEIQLQINGILVESSDLAGPVSIQLNRHLTKNVFCMHASYVGGAAPAEFSTTNAFERQLRIPQKNIALGQHSVVVTNAKEFLQRVKCTVSAKKFAMQARLVDYYNPVTFHGHFSDEDAPFKKHMRFSHQREYRIVVDRPEKDESPLLLNIGNIRDIAHAMSIEALNHSIRCHATQQR